MKYLITGHTGFKGAWLSLMLSELGHELHGFALDPQKGSLFERASLNTLFSSDTRADIRDLDQLAKEVQRIKPTAVIHLAAQPLVQYGYRNPEETFSTNFVGTSNLLSATKFLDGLEATLIVTTDKVYENTSKSRGYVETDPLGGLDPYSASKASADILTQSWSHTFPEAPIAIARAGNVIGGGDVSQDRLIPDMIRAFSENRPALIRNPSAVRPWQYVLDCLSGYLMLLDGISKNSLRGAWNFGPDRLSCRPVEEVANLAKGLWSSSASWENIPSPDFPHEDHFLTLDSTKSEAGLGWKNKYDLYASVKEVVEWERGSLAPSMVSRITRNSVRSFMEYENQSNP